MKQFTKCRQQNLCPQCYAQLHLEVPSMPMHIITMELIVMFKPPPQGYQYALTVIDMLTNCTWCLLLFTKNLTEWHMPT